MGALQYISASALSVTLGGNSGVAPFLTLFIVGIIERIEPSLLNMEDWVSKAVASWPSIAILGALTIVEFVAKCVPCVDAVYESSMAFVAPVLSVLGSMSSFGLFNVVPEEQSRTLYAEYNYNTTDAYLDTEYMEEFNDHRRLAEKSGGLIFLQVMLCFVGVIISILVHLFKLLMRVMGQGCCTCCITSVEYAWTVTSVIITILIVPIAIGTATILIVAAGVGFKKKVLDKRTEEKAKAEAEAAAAAAAVAAAAAAAERSVDQTTDGEKKEDAEKNELCDAPIDEEIGTKTSTDGEKKEDAEKNELCDAPIDEEIGTKTSDEGKVQVVENEYDAPIDEGIEINYLSHVETKTGELTQSE